MFCSLAPVAPRRAAGIARGARESGPQGHSMFAERRVGGDSGGSCLHFGRVRGSAADCRSTIWRV